MAFTQSDLDSLNAAIAGGKKSVQYNGRRVEYQSTKDMLEARRIIQQELNIATGETSGIRRPRGYRAVTGKGL